MNNILRSLVDSVGSRGSGESERGLRAPLVGHPCTLNDQAFKLKVFLLKDPIHESNQLSFTNIELKCRERRKLIIFIKIVSTVSTLEASSKKNSCFRPCLILSTRAHLVLDCPQEKDTDLSVNELFHPWGCLLNYPFSVYHSRVNGIRKVPRWNTLTSNKRLRLEGK